MSPPFESRDSAKAEYSNIEQGSVLPRVRTFDFLRGLAILGVVIVHIPQRSGISIVDHFAGFGRFGVQLFFLVSACTMCHMWKLREGESSPISNFYIRRFFRIAPLFWLAIPLYVLVDTANKNYLRPENIGKLEVFLTATFFHGFWPTSINSVVPGGWSIAVEMTFYALFPALILKIKDKAISYLVLAVFIWGFNVLIFRDLASSFFVNYQSGISTTVVKDFLYFNFINQAPIFLLGCYIYFSLSNKFHTLEVVLFISWFAFGASLRFWDIDGFGFLFAYLILGLFVFICLKENVRSELVEKLGANSYAIYLIHFLVINSLIEILPQQAGLANFLIAFALTTLISFLIALIIHVIIERRIQRLVALITKPRTPKPSASENAGTSPL